MRKIPSSSGAMSDIRTVPLNAGELQTILRDFLVKKKHIKGDEKIICVFPVMEPVMNLSDRTEVYTEKFTGLKLVVGKA